MDSPHSSWLVGWLSCVICLFFTLRCASVFARNQPPLYLALVIYAAQWGVLIVFYSEPKDKLNEFLPALAGFLCIVTASLVFRHVTHDRRMHARIFRREGVMAYLLLLLALPHALQTPYGSILPEGYGHQDVEVVITWALKAIGFYSQYKAVELSCTNKTLRLAVAIPLMAYAVVEAWYTFCWLTARHLQWFAEPVMSASFLYAFAIVKLATVVTFVPAILSPYKPFSELSIVDKVLLFLHIDTRD